MRSTSRVLQHLAMTLAVLALAACSGQQQADEDLEVSEYNEQNQQGEQGQYQQQGNENYEQDQQSDLGNDDAAEGNGQENFVDESDNQENYGDGDNQYTAETNSDTNIDTDYAESNGENATLNYGGEETSDLVSDNDLSGGDYAANNSTQPVPVSTDDMTAAPTGSSPLPGGRVRYVLQDGTQVTNGPGGSIVLTLSQGDHPVTWEENGYYKMAEGYYIAPESMSDSGVGRPIMGSRWQ